MIAPLSDDQLERLAELIADKLQAKADGELIDAAELARRLGRSREFVYQNATALGAIKLGHGSRPRLAFRWPLDGPRGDQSLRKGARPSRPRTRPRETTTVELLPIRGGSR